MNAKNAGAGLEQLGIVKEAGFDYVELPIAQLMDLTEAEFDQAVDQLRALDLPCISCNNFFPTTFRLTGETPDSAAAIDDYVRRAFARMQRLGATTVVFGSGPAKNVPDGFPLEQGYAQVVELLRRIGPIAGSHGVKIAIEPLRRAECNLINTFEEGCRLKDDVGDDNVMVLVDFYHMTMEGEPASNLLDRGLAYLRHVHFAAPEGRSFPTAPDDAVYGDFADALKKLDYPGGVSLEAFSNAPDAQAAAAFSVMQALLKNPVKQ